MSVFSVSAHRSLSLALLALLLTMAAPALAQERPGGPMEPLAAIDAFVAAQPGPVSAHALEAHFSAPDITYGAEHVFNAASTGKLSVAALDDTHFVVAYHKDVISFHGTAIVGAVSGTTITYGAENVFNAALTAEISVAALDATHFVVAYRDDGNSLHGTAIVGAVSGTTITYGAENVFNAAVSPDISLAALDATHFAVAYRDDGNSTHGTAIVGAVSGTTITSYGAENVFNAALSQITSVAALDATHFVVAYQDTGNFDRGTAIVGEVSGTTITYGAESVFNAATTVGISVAALDATHFVVAYTEGGIIHGTAIVGEVSGTTITSYGAENVFNAATTSGNLGGGAR